MAAPVTVAIERRLPKVTMLSWGLLGSAAGEWRIKLLAVGDELAPGVRAIKVVAELGVTARLGQGLELVARQAAGDVVGPGSLAERVVHVPVDLVGPAHVLGNSPLVMTL